MLPSISQAHSASAAAGVAPSLLAAASASPRGRARKHSAQPFPAPLAEFRPTQMAVGMRAVAAKRVKVERRTESARKLRKYLEKRPVPAILGPDGGYHIIDHHHLSLALWQSDVDEAFVTVIGDLSHLSKQGFLQKMSADRLLHSYDADGRRVCPTRLPASLGELKCDSYRDLAWSVREAGGFAKSAAPFAEFRWATFFRERIAAAAVRRDFERAHDSAMRLSRSWDARRLPGYLGPA